MSDDALFNLSRAQQDMLAGGLAGPAVRLQLVTPLPADLDAGALTARWADMTARIDVLRTAFVKPLGLSGLLQTTGAHAAPLTDDSDSVDASTPNGLAEREWTVELDLSSGELVRAAVGGGHLVLTAAAAVADATSLRLLAQELLTGEAAAEDPLPFLDYASWEAEQVEDDTADARVARAYWSGLLGDQMPDDQTTARAQVSGETRPVPVEGVDGLTDEQWLAAWAIVRRRHVSEEDPALLAVAVPGRTDEELEQAIGPLERYVAIVPPADPDADLAATTARISADVEAASRFVMFAPTPPTAVGFSVRPADVRPPVGRFAVELVASGGTATLWYDAALVDEQEAGWLADQVAAAGLAVRDQPQLVAPELDLLGSTERAFLRTALTGLGVEAAHPTVPAALAHHAKQTPEALALANDQQTVTYGELDAQTGRIAAALIDGDGPVGILLDRSLEAVVAALGIMRAGRPYVALEPTHPAPRIQTQVETAEVGTVLTATTHADKLPASVQALTVADLPEPGDGPVGAEVTGASLAYLIFTSGSTGTPKPVAVTQDNLVSYVAGVSERLGLGPSSRLASMTSLATDLGNTSVFGALVNGGTLEVVPEDAVVSGSQLGRLVSDHAVTGLKITPSHLRALLSGGDVRLDLPLLVCGGEPLDAALVEQSRAAGVGRVVNHYGPTETTVGVLSYEVDEPAPTAIPLGRPLPHVTARVVDGRGRSVPVGVVGELEIQGRAVTAGYLGDHSASGFVTGEDGTPCYRTGDLVVVQPDGAVVFVGRADGQVKVRGFRVDLGEIEVRLRTETAVQDAAAVVLDDAIEAFVVTTDQRLDVPAVLDRLRRELPAHMVPAAIRDVAELPRTSSGKIDRNALATAAATPAAATQAAGGRAPSTETEAALLEIWREVMPAAVVGVDDNFFQVGGHSLMATKVIARSRAAFDVDLPLHVIFASPTVAAMAAEIDARRAVEPDDLEALMADLEGMSEEEVAALVREASSSAPDE